MCSENPLLLLLSILNKKWYLAMPSSDSFMLATGSQDTNVKIWDLRTSKSIYTLKGHDDKINTLIFSPSNEWIASADDAGAIKIWSIQTSKSLANLKADGNAVNSIAFNPDVYALAAGNMGRILRYWDLEDFNIISESPIDSSAIRKVCFTPNGKHVFSVTDDSLKVDL